MAHHVLGLTCLITLAATASAEKEQTRWSRQISSYTADISDWVPLPGPVEREPREPLQIKRQAIAEPRILTEPFAGFTRPAGFNQETFPSRTFYQAPSNRQLYLQSVPSVPSAPQNFLTDQGFGQSIRFGLTQPNFPLSQGFVAPQLAFETFPQLKPRPQPLVSNPVKFESFPNSNLPSPQAKPFNQTPVKLENPKFVDGYRAENVSNEYNTPPKKKAQSLQKLKFENFDKLPKAEGVPNKPKIEREEVQLLYVPVESLNRGQYNFRTPLNPSQLSNSNMYSQGLPKPNPLKQVFAADFQRPIAKPVESFSFGQDYFSNFNSQMQVDQTPKFSTLTSPFPTAPPTTPKPKKLKPHQPPLAVFLTQEAKKGRNVRVGDVLSSLKNANTIAVLDAVNPLNAPQVFIGPSSLKPPENFVKFELPYLSNIENSDKKLRQLPFFVAPLSYNTPDGFAKIPFPSPHVGSVVINAQIKETTTTPSLLSTPAADVIPNSYSASPATYRQTQRPTQKPNFSFYSTTPKPYTESNYQSNFYSFEPQTVTSLKPNEPEPSVATVPPKSNSYFLSDVGSQYDPSQYVQFPSQSNLNNPETLEPVKTYSSSPTQKETTTTPRTTTTTTTKPSTIPSQLLETHNPYSINQAFHFSTPLDYHSYFEDFKENYASSGMVPPSTPPPIPSNPSSASPKPEEIVTEKQTTTYHQQSSPNYLQNYSPEIHYESERQSPRYPVYNSNDYTTKPTLSSEYGQIVKTDDNSHIISSISSSPEYNGNIQTQPETQTAILNNNFTETLNEIPTTSSDADIHSTRSPYAYNQYETIVSEEDKPSTTSTTTTTTTRRTPLRSRGRPRYTTPRTDSNESTRTVITRRPLRERRPLPPRPKYEPNKITTEKVSGKPEESNESTTKYYKTRTRGRVHFKPSGNDDVYDKNKGHKNGKEHDLAYQRDVLHQNYPVTLMERMSTVDIEAFTEPAPKTSPAKVLDTATPTYDTDNAYTNERLAVSQHILTTESRETEIQTDAPYVPKLPSSRSDEYIYQSRSSSAPVDAISSYDEISSEKENIYSQTTPAEKTQRSDIISIATEPVSAITELNVPNYSIDKEYSAAQGEEVTTIPNIEITKVTQETSHESKSHEDENVVQTTPSFSRVRVRPGVVRQYHHASSTESSRVKIERRRPAHAVTYRPAFDKRRTTMRIEEIEADLKTKQVHVRPEQDYRHPVYKPEPTTESSVTSSTQDATTKRGHFRRRRPTYTTTSTESTGTRKSSYEIKSRFRGRRPTEKPTDKPEIQTDSTTTARNTFSRYSHRPKLSERYNKKQESSDSEDQDLNDSINVPKYAEPESEQWSPKISSDSFKPYNPNEIVDNSKVATTERRSDVQSELDIITAKNDYDDILISVTPATNNRLNKKIPDIPPTLEALVEQTKVSKSESSDGISTFESMLEEVMKSLEEQDENEYTTNVMKHKGGEIGEIPPERIISSEEYAQKSTTLAQQEVTTPEPTVADSTLQTNEEKDPKSRRRGFWKKVKVRPATTESIEVAESQFYHHTVNQLGEYVKLSKNDISDANNKSKYSVTTYKPAFQFIKEIFESEEELMGVLPTADIPKINNKTFEYKKDKATTELPETTNANLEKETPNDPSVNPGEFDLGTGSPDTTVVDYYSTPTEKSFSESTSIMDRSDGFSFMDYLFGVSSSDNQSGSTEKIKVSEKFATTSTEIEVTTEPIKSKLVTTESTFVPEEITALPSGEGSVEVIAESVDVKRTNSTTDVKQETSVVTEKSVQVETSSVSSFMDPGNIVSTSMSTEISHETEICFRGKCIKTSKDINL